MAGDKQIWLGCVLLFASGAVFGDQIPKSGFWDMTFADIFEPAVTFIGVVVAGYFGREGLRTWREQTKGTSDHDLARRMLILIYRYRGAMSAIRNPIIWPAEMEPDPDEERAERRGVETFRGVYRAYGRRELALNNARTEVEASLLECEAVWGDELKDSFSKLLKLEREFKNYLIYHLRQRNPEILKEEREEYVNILKEMRDVLYESHDDKKDEFGVDFQNSVKTMEDYLRSRLIR